MAKRFSEVEFQNLLAGVRAGEHLGELLRASGRDRDTFDRHLSASHENQAAYDQAKVSRSPSGRGARVLTGPVIQKVLEALRRGETLAMACLPLGPTIRARVRDRAVQCPAFATQLLAAADAKALDELNARRLTAKTAQDLIDAIAGGQTKRAACMHLDISEWTVRRRAAMCNRFAAALSAAQAQGGKGRRARTFTAEVQNRMVQAVRGGADFKGACAAVGVRRSSGDTRLATDPEFKRRMIEAGLHRVETAWKGENGRETERAVLDALRRGAPRCAFTSIGLPKWDTVLARISQSPRFAAAVRSAARAGRKQRIRHWNERDYESTLAGLKRGESWRTLAERGLPGKAAVQSHRTRHPSYDKRYLEWRASQGTRAQVRAETALAANPSALDVRAGHDGAVLLLKNLDLLIPFYLDPEIRRDIKQQMATDVYAGELSARTFKSALKRYIEQAREGSGKGRNLVSIDAQQGDNKGHSLHNMLTTGLVL